MAQTQTTYIEHLSPTQLYSLAQTARGKLTHLAAQPVRNIAHVLADALLLEHVEHELKRQQREAMLHERPPLLLHEQSRNKPSFDHEPSRNNRSFVHVEELRKPTEVTVSAVEMAEEDFD